MPIPTPFDPARAARTFEALAEHGFVPPHAQAQALLCGAFGNSPFLAHLATRETETLEDYFASGPEAILREAKALALMPFCDEAQAMAALRRAKRKAALAIALADLAGWSLDQVTAALTAFADACVQGALRFLLTRMAAHEGLAGQDGEELESTTGLTILAMGKY